VQRPAFDGTPADIRSHSTLLGFFIKDYMNYLLFTFIFVSILFVIGMSYILAARAMLKPLLQKTSVLDVSVVGAECIGVVARWLGKHEQVPHDTGPFLFFDLYGAGAKLSDVELTAQSWRIRMKSHPWAYPASQRQRLEHYIDAALAYVKLRDTLEKEYDRFERDAKEARERFVKKLVPKPATTGWRAALGLNIGERDEDVVKQAYRRLAREAHPDRGGSNEAMTALNIAIDQARKELGIA